MALAQRLLSEFRARLVEGGAPEGYVAYAFERPCHTLFAGDLEPCTKRQYALRERAVALGWSLDRIDLVDVVGPTP